MDSLDPFIFAISYLPFFIVFFFFFFLFCTDPILDDPPSGVLRASVIAGIHSCMLLSFYTRTIIDCIPQNQLL
jgi:hypothetical protein